jgi:uncharacterized protein YqeY
MSKLIAQMRQEIAAAMKSGDTVRRDVLKVVVAETESAAIRQSKQATDEMVYGVIRKSIEGNTESLGHLPATDARHGKLTQENAILTSYLPVMLSLDQVVAELATITADITAAKSDGQATGVAMKLLKGKNLAVDGNTVTQAVKQIRTAK